MCCLGDDDDVPAEIRAALKDLKAQITEEDLQLSLAATTVYKYYQLLHLKFQSPEELYRYILSGKSDLITFHINLKIDPTSSGIVPLDGYCYFRTHHILWCKQNGSTAPKPKDTIGLLKFVQETVPANDGQTEQEKEVMEIRKTVTNSLKKKVSTLGKKNWGTTVFDNTISNDGLLWKSTCFRSAYTFGFAYLHASNIYADFNIDEMTYSKVALVLMAPDAFYNFCCHNEHYWPAIVNHSSLKWLSMLNSAVLKFSKKFFEFLQLLGRVKKRPDYDIYEKIIRTMHMAVNTIASENRILANYLLQEPKP